MFDFIECFDSPNWRQRTMGGLLPVAFETLKHPTQKHPFLSFRKRGGQACG
jgi:hypothetical protein